MLVRICQDIFLNQENDSQLDDLFTFFKLGKHQLVLNDPDDFLAFNESTWKKSLKGDNLKLIQKGLKISDRNKMEILVSEIKSETSFLLNEAYLFLNQPLVVLVENKEFEPPFLNSIIRNFDTGEIDDAHRNKWWKYEMFAGSSVEQVIRGELMNEFKNDLFVKKKHKYLRYFVIIDSDKTHPNMINNSLSNKIKYLESIDVKYHILFKREKENYVPEKILKAKNEKYFNCYLEVFKDSKKSQRDFFDMEKGFNNKNKTDKNWDKDRKEEADFFEIKSIKDSDWEILKKGVNDKQAFKATFSNEFNSVEKSDFLQVIKYQPFIKSETDGIERNEFEHIINEIKRLL